MYIHIYIYIYRERERDIDMYTYIWSRDLRLARRAQAPARDRAGCLSEESNKVI